MSSSPVTASTVTPASQSRKEPERDKAKDIVGDVVGGFFKKLGIDFVAKLAGKAPGPLGLIATGIEIFKAGVPLVKKIFGLFGGDKDKKENPAQQAQQAQGSNPALAGRAAGQADYRALLADPRVGPQISRLMELGGLGAIQRAAAEGRLPKDREGLEALYRSGANAVLEQVLPNAGKAYDRTGDYDQVAAQLRPYLGDAKISLRDLGILLDENRSLDDRYAAFERILQDVTRQPERAQERPQEKSPEKAAEKAAEEKTPTKDAAPTPQEDQAARKPVVEARDEKGDLAPVPVPVPGSDARVPNAEQTPDRSGALALAEGEKNATPSAETTGRASGETPGVVADRPTPGPALPEILDRGPVAGGFDRSR